MKLQVSQEREREHESSLREFLTKELKRINDRLSIRKKQDFLSIIEQQEKERSSFISSYRRIPVGCESFLVVLRKWNSYTPSLPVAEETFKKVSQYSIGGGYFLFVQGEENTLDPGYGLVIDPGYNFIHNFGSAGFCLDDIDGILITHAHNDHTNDFESLLSLLYQRNNKFLEKRAPRKIDLFLNVGSFKKFSNYLDLANKNERNYIGDVIVMSPGQVYSIRKRENLDFQIFTLFTNHHEIVTADYALGLCFKLSDRIVLMTGDTGWKAKTALKNKAFLLENNCFKEKEEERVDILVPHIGTIIRKEFEIKNTDADFEQNYYDTHLGILGTIRSIEQWKPEFCIISEFGEELAGLREKLVSELDKTCKQISRNTYCVPGDVGLFVLLDRKQAICYMSNKPIDWSVLYYKDVENALWQDSIKYISKRKVMRLSYRKRSFFLKNLQIKNGLQKFKEYYYNELIKSFKITRRFDKVISLLNDLLTIKLDIDSADPSDIEECENNIIGRLMALSCINDNPEKLLDIMMNGWSSHFVLEALRNYHFYVNDLLADFALKVSVIGFGETFSAEDIQNQEGIKAYLEDFLAKYKEMLSYYGKKEHYSEFRAREEELKSILAKIT